MLLTAVLSCSTEAERAAGELARRVVPEYAGRMTFRETSDDAESYSIEAQGRRLLISGSGANALCAGLGRYLRDVAGVDISWKKTTPATLHTPMPLPDSTIRSEALADRRFFLNYCTYGYAMPWWKWEEWEHFIDWMALQGINMPLALTGQEAVLQELWRRNGLDDEEILAWFTGPAHLPWHRMCNIDGVDGPLPQSWIDGQEALQKQILSRERELGMTPVLPAFCGHVPKAYKALHPGAQITDISGWAGFPAENLPCFLSPQDSLFESLQRQYLSIQCSKYGSSHIYGFDLFNEVDPPSWDTETLAEISRCAYGSIASFDPDAEWLQMGWMFYYDRKHWTPEIVKAYLEAVPRGKVTILDYYTENIPVWTLTERFYGQPFIFCYLGNFGGNTRLAVPFRKESARLGAALTDGGAGGIGCTLEGFGLNRWFYEYIMDRGWSGGLSDDEWLSALDRRRNSPSGFWEEMADSILVRPALSRGPLICVRPRMAAGSASDLSEAAAADNPALVASWEKLLNAPADSPAWRYDAVCTGSQALGYRFAELWGDFCRAYRNEDASGAEITACRMKKLLRDIDYLSSFEPELSLNRWLEAAASWGKDTAERQYYRHNAWLIVTRWGDPSRLGDYACRLWSGLISGYYAPRWELFLDEVLSCIREGREYDALSMNAALDALERTIVESAPAVQAAEPREDLHSLCNKLHQEWFFQ